MTPTVYRIDFPDGQFYIGSTVNFAERRRTHLRHSKAKKAVNQKLQAAFDQHPVCCIYQVASGMSRDDLHAVEAVVIAQEQPTLNVNTKPTPLPGRYSGAAKPWGPHKCIRDAADALGVTYLAAKKAAQRHSYEEYRLLISVRSQKRPAVQGPPDPRKNSHLVFLNGAWVRRKDVRVVSPETYAHRRSAGWSVEDALITPRGCRRNPSRVSVASVCTRYGVAPNTYYARRRIGWSMYEALGLQPRSNERKPKMQPKLLTLDGKTRSLNDWARRLGISPNVLHSRLHAGWSVERALTTPHKKELHPPKPAKPTPTPRPTYELNGVTGSVRDLADHFRVSYSTLYYRINAGWPKEFWLAASWFPLASQPSTPTPPK